MVAVNRDEATLKLKITRVSLEKLKNWKENKVRKVRKVSTKLQNIQIERKTKHYNTIWTCSLPPVTIFTQRRDPSALHYSSRAPSSSHVCASCLDTDWSTHATSSPQSTSGIIPGTSQSMQRVRSRVQKKKREKSHKIHSLQDHQNNYSNQHSTTATEFNK